MVQDSHPVLRHHAKVLDADSDPARQVNAGLAGKHIAGRNLIRVHGVGIPWTQKLLFIAGGMTMMI